VTGQLLSLGLLALVCTSQLTPAQVGLKYSLLGMRIKIGIPHQCPVTGQLLSLGSLGLLAVVSTSQPIQAQVGLKHSLLGMRIKDGTPCQCPVTGQLLSLESLAVVSISAQPVKT